jgi:hypothetical protein
MATRNRHSAHEEKDPAGDDFSRYLQLLELYQADGDWDDYFALATAPGFQEDLAAWAFRTGEAGAAGPLRVLESALGQAVKMRRIGDVAALTLATAHWTRRLSVHAALGAAAAAEPGLAGEAGPTDRPHGEAAEIELRTGGDVLRALLRAWERYDAGNRGAARSLLAAIVRGRPPLISTSDGDRWAVPLLREALVIDPDAAVHLLGRPDGYGLVDDNVLGDLARELTAAGEYTHARMAGGAMRLFFETKADVLADLALAQAEAALKQGAAGRQEAMGGVPLAEPIGSPDLRAVADTANLAADAAQQALREGPGATMAPRAPRVAGRLAKAAAALTLSGEDALAAQRWAEAMAAGEQEPDPHQVLADFAQAQVRAGLFDDAAQVIAVLLNESPASAGDWRANAVLDPAWQAATALVVALAERGDVAGAVAALRMIPDFAHSYPRAVRAVACAVVATDVREAELLAERVGDPDGRGWALAAVAIAALAAGHQRDAVRMAGGIELPRWRARALVDLAGAAGQAASIPFGEVRAAIAAVTDAGESAVLLAGYAVTRDAGECRRLLAEATRLAGEAPADDRWRALANIGAAAAEVGLATDAREAFTAAQRLLARDPREWDFELYQLCQVRLNVGDTAGARETAAVALSAMPGRTAAGRVRSAVGAASAAPASRRAGRSSRRARVADPALNPAVAAVEAAADIPMTVAALAAIACAMGGAAGLPGPSSARAAPPEMTEPEGGNELPREAGQIERVLAEAERLATGLRDAGAIAADESLVHAYTALGDFAAAERRILSLLPPPDPGSDQDTVREPVAAGDNMQDAGYERDAYTSDDDDDVDENADGTAESEDETSLVAVAQERGIALADALVAAGESPHAAAFMREVAARLSPCAWRLGPGAADMLAELAAAQVRAGDLEGARTTAAFAATVASAMNASFRLPEPFGLPMADETDTVATVVDAMTALMREAEIGSADFNGAGQRAVDYARRPWQARARTLAARAPGRANPAQRARLAALLAEEQEQIWRLATVTFVRGATLDPDDAVEALAVLAGAQAALGELADARQAIARARQLAADIEDRGERARALAEVVRGLSAVGDHAAAVTVARGIDQPVYEGQAMAAAITAAAKAGIADRMDLIGQARAVKDKGWSAIALVAVAVAGAAPLDLAEAHALIGRVAHGAPRARVWREIINRCVAAGRYDLAVGLAEEITEDAALHLAVIAVALGLHATDDDMPPGESPVGQQAAVREAAGDALLRLLPRCARYPESAYAACTALAMAFPAKAAVVAGAVAQHAAGNLRRARGKQRQGEAGE